METLQLVQSVRAGSSNKTERNYFDFYISGKSLKELLGQENSDLITPFILGNEEYSKRYLKVFKLQEKSDLNSGRVMIYVCPECGDIDCGAITAIIQDCGDRIVWKDFGYETGYEGISERHKNVCAIEFERQTYFNAFSIFR